jgi:hypothetical protein
MNTIPQICNSDSSPINSTDIIAETIDIHRVARTMTTQATSLTNEILDLEIAAGIRTLAKWEQKRLRLMRLLLSRYTGMLAVYTYRFN